MSKVIYTVLFDDYEELKEPLVITPGWKYVCITDQEISSKIWEIRIIPPQYLFSNTILNARFYKINRNSYFFKQTIYIDASFQINCNLDEFWAKNFKAPFSAPRHPIRNDVYLEADACLSAGRGDELNINKQIQSYFGVVPVNNGLIQSGILLRDNSTACADLCSDWWNEVKKNSTRDQIAFAKVSLGHQFHTFNFDYRTSKEFIYTKHFKYRKP